jgi:hypothetical protein
MLEFKKFMKQKPASRGLFILERVNGIEPSYAAWEAAVLPLNYTRVKNSFTKFNFFPLWIPHPTFAMQRSISTTTINHFPSGDKR